MEKAQSTITFNNKTALIVVLTLFLIVFSSIICLSIYYNWIENESQNEKINRLETKNDILHYEKRILENKLLYFSGQMRVIQAMKKSSISDQIDLLEKNMCDVTNFLSEYGVMP
jgi:hypothetical protein